MLENLYREIDDVIRLAETDADIFAVGVSGGADSLALIYYLKEWADIHDKKIIALTVDHQLRPSSTKEARYVASLMKTAGIEHHVLVWEGEKPKNSIETQARLKRYELLENWCLSHGINNLFIAHHKQDQAETFLMRLHRGSGIDGLCGISPISKLGKIQVLRPLLKTSPEDLKNYLVSKNIKWVEDESNFCEDFLRVKARNFLPVLEEKLGINIERIVDTMEVLKRTRSYLDEQTEKFIKNHVKFWEGAGVSLSLKSLENLHEEIVYRVFCNLLKLVGNKYYAPRSEDVQRLYHQILAEQKEFKGSTLGGCEIFEAQGKIWIIPELKEKTVLAKKVWEEFAEKHLQYKKISIPYKMRLSLVKIKPIY